MNTLRSVPVGQSAHVIKVHGEGALRRRIMDMGLTKNTEIYVQKVAPFGDPMELIVRGYSLTLRRADAEMIEVREKHTSPHKHRLLHNRTEAE